MPVPRRVTAIGRTRSSRCASADDSLGLPDVDKLSHAADTHSYIASFENFSLYHYFYDIYTTATTSSILH